MKDRITSRWLYVSCPECPGLGHTNEFNVIHCQCRWGLVRRGRDFLGQWVLFPIPKAFKVNQDGYDSKDYLVSVKNICLVGDSDND